MFNFKGTKKLQGESPRPGERSDNVRYILTLSDGKYSYAVNSERMEGRACDRCCIYKFGLKGRGYPEGLSDLSKSVIFSFVQPSELFADRKR